MSRQTLKARKALRSAAAKKGWETRREMAAAERHVADIVATHPVAKGEAFAFTVLHHGVPVADPNPWPAIAAAVKQGVMRVAGWLR